MSEPEGMEGPELKAGQKSERKDMECTGRKRGISKIP